MVPLADTHVHLLAGTDDGPRTAEEAVAMCRMLVAEGARFATALAHQHPFYPDNTPDRLRAAAAELIATLKAENIPLAVYPSAEIMLTPELAAEWSAGRLLSLADRGQWLLVEMPNNQFVDLRPVAAELKPLGVRIVVAHAERYEPLLHDLPLAVEFIAAGCLLQVTTGAIADPPPGDEPAIKQWAKAGMIHVLGSDGHRLDRRQPRLQAGFETLARWVGPAAADVIGGIRGAALLQGLNVTVPAPKPPKASWFTRLFGG